jgi:alanine dehydrogenase
VLVIGGGMVGYNAAVIALGMGAQVTILERSVDRMRFLEQILSGRVQLLMSSALQLEESIKDADLTIGAVLIPARERRSSSPRDARDDEGELGLRRRRHRPGRVRRDVEADDALTTRV